MRLHYDRRDKRLALRAYEGSGEVCAQFEVAIDALYIDLTFEPDPARMKELDELGLFGRLGTRSLELEFFHRAPSTEEVLDCWGKHAIRERLVRKARKKEAHQKKEAAGQGNLGKDSRSGSKPGEPMPWMWLICSGNPETAIAELGFRQAAGWPKGFYNLKERYGFGIIVLGELETNRETLLLRLFGKGKVLAQARKELEALPPNAPEWRIVMFVDKVRKTKQWDPVAFRKEVAAFDKALDARDRRLVAKGERRGLAKGEHRGLTQGLSQGLTKALVTTFEMRFGPMPVRLRRQLERVRDEAALLDCQKCAVSAASAREFGKSVRARIGN